VVDESGNVGQVTALEGATHIQMADGEYRLTFPGATDWQSNGEDKVYRLVVEGNQLFFLLFNSATNTFDGNPEFSYLWDKTQQGKDRYEDGGPVGVAPIYYIQVTGSLSNGGYAVLDESCNVGQVTVPHPVSVGDYELTGLGKTEVCEVTATAYTLLVYEAESPDTYVWNSETNRFEEEGNSSTYYVVTARQDGNGYDVSDNYGWSDGRLITAPEQPEP
jgi:predicted heme/steroid binding protein